LKAEVAHVSRSVAAFKNLLEEIQNAFKTLTAAWPYLARVVERAENESDGFHG
jgi:hypothetical protein